jgi:hypothetical protein
MACALLVLTAACASQDREVYVEPADVESLASGLAPGIPICESVAITNESVQAGCELRVSALQRLTAAASASDTAPRIEAARLYELSLHAGADGYVGFVRFVASASGEHVFFPSDQRVPVGVRAGGDPTPAELCGKYVSADRQLAATGTACLPQQVGLVTPALIPGVEYLIALGPVPVRHLRFMALAQRQPGAVLRGDVPACAEATPDAATCAAASSTTPITAGTLGTQSLPRITRGTAYGVRLREYRGQYEGSLTFTAPERGTYTLYLGAPHLGVALQAKGHARRLTPSCGSEVSSSSCGAVRGLYKFEADEGTELRIDLTTPGDDTTRWVRLLIQSEPLPQATPIPVQGLATWLRSDSGVTFAAGDRVLEWANRAPHSTNDARPPSEVRRPYLVPDGPNGHPWIRFTGGESLVLAQPLTLERASIFFVGRSTTTNVSASALVLGPRVGQTDDYVRWQAENYLRVSLAGLNYGQVIWTNTRVAHLSAAVVGNSFISLYANGVYRGGFGNFGARPSQLGEIGSRYGGNRLQGDLAEIIVYDRALNEAELAEVHNYLLTRYALP